MNKYCAASVSLQTAFYGEYRGDFGVKESEKGYGQQSDCLFIFEREFVLTRINSIGVGEREISVKIILEAAERVLERGTAERDLVLFG